MTTTPQPPKPYKVLFPLHPNQDALDFIGPLEILSHAHFPSPSTPAFTCTITSSLPLTPTRQGVAFARDIDLPTAHATLSDYDILIVPGGSAPATLAAEVGEPMKLISAFAKLGQTGEGGGGKRQRILFSVCTGAIFLAAEGVLKGLTATTHPVGLAQLKELTKDQGTTVLGAEARFVVNRMKGGGGEKEGKGGVGLVITSGGVSCGLDAAVWLVGELVGEEARRGAVDMTQYRPREGVVL